MADRLIIGLMSGTSVDGIDAALVRVGGVGGRYRAMVVAHVERGWPEEVRGRLLAVMAPAVVATGEICALNFLVAREFAAAVGEVLRAAGVGAGRIEAVASHGQTICHLPLGGNATRNTQNAKVEGRNPRCGSTLQIGDISVLAALTGMRVVGNFRAADVAAGGQGAPLVPFADAMLLSDRKVTRCVQNIGGIANVTYLPVVSGQWSVARSEGVIAFDTGPGNMVMDAVVGLGTGGKQRYDRGGRMAARGRLDEGLLERLRGHPFFERRPPKSTGREEFGVDLAREILASIKDRRSKLEDAIHTVTRLTAWSIGEAYRRFLPRMPEEVILCGGGADNPVLVGMLGEELRAGAMLSGLSSRDLRNEGRDAPLSMAHVRLRRIDELGIPNKAKEAACFAVLAAATLDGVAGNLPSATGARRGVVLGEIADPRVRARG